MYTEKSYQTRGILQDRVSKWSIYHDTRKVTRLCGFLTHFGCYSRHSGHSPKRWDESGAARRRGENSESGGTLNSQCMPKELTLTPETAASSQTAHASHFLFGREVQETNGCGLYGAVYRTDTARPTCELTACPLVACPHGPMIGFHAVVHLRSCRSVCGTTSARKSYQMWPGPLHLGPGHAGGGSGMLQHQRLP